ncbi:TPA_asm: coat protein [Cardamom polerovirus]|nr:TPA_asm: coat protein [Cardamom polerovirus]
MNSARGKRNGRSRRRRRNNQTRRQQVVVVAQPRPQRRNRRRRNRNAGGGSGLGRRLSSEKFVFSKDSIQGNASGYVTFGPSLSECKPFSSGILQAYHEYKITMVEVKFISEASTTSAGSLSYELDPHLRLSELKSTINKFGLKKDGIRRFSAGQINGTEWHANSEDQFRFFWKGNGSSGTLAGSFVFTIFVTLQNPQ